MNESDLKEVLKNMTTEIYKTFRLLSDENKKLEKRIEELEKKVKENPSK